jgi:hypothetical protein
MAIAKTINIPKHVVPARISTKAIAYTYFRR